jgi:hypothetical protein
MTGRRLALIASALTLASCARKLPGPVECQHFAELVVGVARDDPRLTIAAARRLEDLTQQCLTTPYDYELLRCVEGTGLAQQCLVSFNARARARAGAR